jgi:hypothetical protein
MTRPSNKELKLTKPGQVGASQLNSGVGRTGIRERRPRGHVLGDTLALWYGNHRHVAKDVMTRPSDLRSRALEVVDLALLGRVSLDALYELWPASAEESAFCRQVLEDLEDVVEHWPAEWGVDALEADRLLLARAEADEILLKCREEVLRRIAKLPEPLERLVARFFAGQ